MAQHEAKRKLSAEESRQLLDDYMQYRFRQQLDPEDLAKKAGVKSESIQRLLRQQEVDQADLTRVAHALGMSGKLLREICGLDEMASDTLETVRKFMAATLGKNERAHGA